LVAKFTQLVGAFKRIGNTPLSSWKRTSTNDFLKESNRKVLCFEHKFICLSLRTIENMVNRILVRNILKYCGFSVEIKINILSSIQTLRILSDACEILKNRHIHTLHQLLSIYWKLWITLVFSFLVHWR